MSQKTVSTGTALKSVKIVFGIILSVIFYVLVIIFISRFCKNVFDFGYQIFGNVSVTDAPGTDIDFTIGDSESTMSVATKLEYNKLVVNKYSFYIRAQLSASGEGSPILPGTYELNTSMNYDEILSVITDYGQNTSQDEE